MTNLPEPVTYLTKSRRDGVTIKGFPEIPSRLLRTHGGKHGKKWITPGIPSPGWDCDWNLENPVTNPCPGGLPITMPRYILKSWVWLDILSRDLPESRHHLEADPQLLRWLVFKLFWNLRSPAEFGQGVWILTSPPFCVPHKTLSGKGFHSCWRLDL